VRNYTQISQRLPRFLKASSHFGYGTTSVKQENIHHFSHIQCNPRGYQYRMVFDLDYHVSLSDFDQLQTPNWIAFNPQNGHAHVAYELEIPIHRYDGARHHPLQWGAKVQYAYTKKLRADPGYAEFLMKNPLHIQWDVRTLSKELICLEDMAKFIKPSELPKYITKKVAETCHLSLIHI
jgi:hypothetical protein